jgi:chromosome segregation ATPase
MDEEGLDPIEKLKRELEHERQEKENLAAQYRNLLAKLTTMRTSLGNKLQQDAVRFYWSIYFLAP